MQTLIIVAVIIIVLYMHAADIIIMNVYTGMNAYMYEYTFMSIEL